MIGGEISRRKTWLWACFELYNYTYSPWFIYIFASRGERLNKIWMNHNLLMNELLMNQNVKFMSCFTSCSTWMAACYMKKMNNLYTNRFGSFGVYRKLLLFHAGNYIQSLPQLNARLQHKLMKLDRGCNFVKEMMSFMSLGAADSKPCSPVSDWAICKCRNRIFCRTHSRYINAGLKRPAAFW